MNAQNPRTLNHFSLFAFKDAYWMMNEHAKASFHQHWLAGLGAAATNFDVYQNTDSRGDLLVWCAVNGEDADAASTFFAKFATILTPYRHLLQPVDMSWGYTGPARSEAEQPAQEIDPFATTRMRYLVAFPFVTTGEWKMMSQQVRQGMMEEHVRIGKQYEDIRQLLLYSFGLQDQQSMVIYETENLVHFSDLMRAVRDAEVGRFPLQDTPAYTAIYHPATDTLALTK